MFDYSTTQADVTALIADMGLKVTLQKVSGSNVKTYALWGKSESVQTDGLVVAEHKSMYMSGAIKKFPEVGDSITVSGASWRVDTVEAYKPASTVIAYKLAVSQ